MAKTERKRQLPRQPRWRRTDYELLLTLCQKQEWLGTRDREAGVTSLLRLCEDGDERALVCSLLYGVTFLTSASCQPYFEGMVNQILKNWQLPEDRTQIVATTNDDEGDSAQAVLQALKPEFQKQGWEKVCTVNRLGKSVAKLRNRPNVVLVDEFIGTGTTIASSIRHIQSCYEEAMSQNNLPSEYNLHVCVLASMQEGKARVERLDVKMHAELPLKKGISDHLDGKEYAEACSRMLSLEAKLAPQINGRPLPSFGWGEAEALFSTDENTPNSVFPVFWWSRLRNNKKRRTILHRLEHIDQ